MIIVGIASSEGFFQPDGDFRLIILSTDLIGLLEGISQEIERLGTCPLYRLNGIPIPAIWVDDIDSLFEEASGC